MSGVGRISKIAYTEGMEDVLYEPSRQQLEGAFNLLSRKGGKAELRYIYEPTENILYVAPAQDYLHPQMRDKVGIPHEKGVSGGFIYPQNLEEMKAKHIQPKDWVRAKNGYRGSLHGADLKENIEPCVNEEQSDPVPIEISPGKTLIPFPGEIEAIAVRRMSKIASFGNGIIKNPQAGVVAKQLENARYHNLRYLEFAGEIFIVDAANLDHGELADEIGLTDNWSVHGASMPFSLRNDYALSGYIYPGDIPAIKSAGLRNWIDDRHHRENLLMISPTRKQLEETNDEYGAVFPRRRGHLAYGDKPLIDPSLQLLEAMLKRSGRPSLRYIIWGGHRYYTTGDKTHQNLADQIGIPWEKQTKEGLSGFIEADDIQSLLSRKASYAELTRWERENALEGAVLSGAEDRRKAHVAMIDLETTETWENPSKQQLQGILNAMKRAGADEGYGQLEFRYVIHSDGMGHSGVTYGIASNTKHDILLEASGTAKARWPYCYGGMLNEKQLQSCSNTESLREYEKKQSLMRGRYSTDRSTKRESRIARREPEHIEDVSRGGFPKRPVYINPGPSRLKGLVNILNKSGGEYGEPAVRMLRADGNVYVWDAASLTHERMYRVLCLEHGAESSSAFATDFPAVSYSLQGLFDKRNYGVKIGKDGASSWAHKAAEEVKWVEDQHPRGEDGRFTDGDSASPDAPEWAKPKPGDEDTWFKKPEVPEHLKKIPSMMALGWEDPDECLLNLTDQKERACRTAAKFLGYPDEMVHFRYDEHVCMVGDKKFKAAGLAYIKPSAMNEFDVGHIAIYPDQIDSRANVWGVMAHEIEHQKYQTVKNALKAETDNVMKDPETKSHYVTGDDGNFHPAGMLADGSLAPPLDKKYPLYTRFHKYTEANNELISKDGVTDYSSEYWNAYKNSKYWVSLESAYHETVAEIAKLHHMYGDTLWTMKKDLAESTKKLIGQNLEDAKTDLEKAKKKRDPEEIHACEEWVREAKSEYDSRVDAPLVAPIWKGYFKAIEKTYFELDPYRKMHQLKKQEKKSDAERLGVPPELRDKK